MHLSLELKNIKIYALSSCTVYLFYDNWPVSDLHSNYSAQLSELTNDCHDRKLDLTRGALLSADGIYIHKSAKLDVVSSIYIYKKPRLVILFNFGINDHRGSKLYMSNLSQTMCTLYMYLHVVIIKMFLKFMY